MSRPICKQCWGKTTRIPWVDQPLQRTDELTEPLSVHTLKLSPKLDDSDIAEMQREDAILAPVIDWLANEYEPTPDDVRTLPLPARTLWSLRANLAFNSGILITTQSQGHTQLIVPAALQRRLFDAAHAGPLAAHLGAKRTLQQLQTSYYWPGMCRDINSWYQQCPQCNLSKPAPSRSHAPLTKVMTGAPLDIVAIDILSGLPATSLGYKYILVATDYFTKWLEAYPLRDCEASTCMRALYNGFFSRFGLPRQLHSDQGRNFESRLVAELCKITGVYKTRTTPFHPRSDGQTERANRTILRMLRTTAEDNPADRPNRLPVYSQLTE